MLVQLLHSTTAALTKILQRNDDRLSQLRQKVKEKKDECDKSEKRLKQLVDWNAKKDYWGIYQFREKIKKEDKTMYTSLFVSKEMKKEAIKEILAKGAGKGKTDEDVIEGIPIEMILKKMR